MKYFIYARKSTDEPERQVLSIEAQITELKELAEREHIEIVNTFIESQTAKEPGRPIFNDMLSRMEKGGAQGILAWHPDRLARNSVDGWQSYLSHRYRTHHSAKIPDFLVRSYTPRKIYVINRFWAIKVLH